MENTHSQRESSHTAWQEWGALCSLCLGRFLSSEIFQPVWARTVWQKCPRTTTMTAKSTLVGTYLHTRLPCLHPRGKKLSFLVSLSEAKHQRPEATLSSQALSPSLEPSGVSWPACDLLNRKSLHHYSPKICFDKAKRNTKANRPSFKTFYKNTRQVFHSALEFQGQLPFLVWERPSCLYFYFSSFFSLAVLSVVLFYYCSGSTMIKISGIKMPVPRILCGTMLCN